METVIETIAVQPPLPPFNVSIDSPPWDGETEKDHAAHVNRNANHAQHRVNEATIMLAKDSCNGE